ncbi:MAG: BlaI/MecI/CopY family transcriptional regulator [Rhodothermales bacterium]|nr:BlaI/MecI/CopY family transcriptional regulator [Rhodothermales bacterium]
MDVIYRLGEATAAEVMDNLPDPPSYSAVRALLRILGEKGHVKHEKVGPRYVYQPVVPADTASEHALKHVVATFFSGSVSQAVAALLEASDSQLSDEELKRLESRIQEAREEGR